MKRTLSLLWFPCVALSLLLVPPRSFGGTTPVTAEQLKATHKAYLEARKDHFSEKSLAALYSGDNAVAAVKKLVDLGNAAQSDGTFPTGDGVYLLPGDSAPMAKAREAMHMRVLRHLAAMTGGVVQTMDAGKTNGIRSDKDIVIFGVEEGIRPMSAAQMKAFYEHHFEVLYSVTAAQMDIALHDADAVVPDWRQADVSLDSYVEKFKNNQAKLESNPAAVGEAGAFRQGVEKRYAESGKITMVRLKTGQAENNLLPQVNHSEVEFKDTLDSEWYEVVDAAPVREVTALYESWKPHVPYRCAMDSVLAWSKHHFEDADFVDRQKYFNRVVGDGIKALALEGRDQSYLKQLAALEKPADRRALIEQILNDVFIIDVSADHRQQMARVLEISAQIELDKIHDVQKLETTYFEPVMAVVRKDALANKETLTDAQILQRAREKFSGFQKDVVRYALVATARQKLRLDLGDSRRMALLVEKYTDRQSGHDGMEEVLKLQWETWHQFARAFDQVNDPALVARIVSEAPESLRPGLQAMADVARAGRDFTTGGGGIQLADSDEQTARTRGPSEGEALKAPESRLAKYKAALQAILDHFGKPWDDFKRDWKSGEYTEDAIAERIRGRVFGMLGYEEVVVVKKMEVDYETRFSGSRLFRNVVNMGNANSLLNVVRVYQKTGDWKMVAQTATFEVVSHVPGVAALAALRQTFNDGEYENLTFLFLAHAVPGAGEVKLVFDVAKGSLDVIYTYAMDPIKDDRFSQVYMGYVDKQPAGWTPFKPGWKERQQAVGDSILHFVPGDTFEQKRSNLFSYFHAKLETKVRAAGFDPADKAAYAAEFEKVLPAFFQKYVSDYFNAAGEWHDNTTVGLHPGAWEQEIKDRTIAQLVRDYRQGEINHEQSEDVRQKLQDAIGQIDDVVGQRIDLERQSIAAEDFLATHLQDRFKQAIKDAKPPTGGKGIVRVEAFPSTVTEGGQATITVQVVGTNGSAQAPAANKIEVKRVDDGAAANAPPLVMPAQPATQPAMPLKLSKLREELKEDVDFAASLIGEKEADKKEYYLKPVTYEVTVRTSAGELIDRQRVGVRLAGGELPAALGALSIITRRCDEPRGNLIVIASDAIAKLDKTKPDEGLVYTLMRSQSPDGPWKEVPLGAPGIAPDQAVPTKVTEKIEGLISANQAQIHDVFPDEDAFNKLPKMPFYYRVIERRQRVVWVGTSAHTEPFGEAVQSNVSALGDVVLSCSSDTPFSGDQRWLSANIALSMDNQRFDFPAAHFVVSSGSWTGNFYSGTRARIDDNPCALVVPYQLGAMRITVTATQGANSAARSFTLPTDDGVTAASKAAVIDWAEGRRKSLESHLKYMEELKKDLADASAALPKAAAKDVDEAKKRVAAAAEHIRSSETGWATGDEMYFQEMTARASFDWPGAVKVYKAKRENDKAAFADALRERSSRKPADDKEKQSVQRDIEDQKSRHREQRTGFDDAIADAARSAGDLAAVLEAMKDDVEALQERKNTEGAIAGAMSMAADSIVMLGGSRQEAAQWWLRGQRINAARRAADGDATAMQQLELTHPTWWPEEPISAPPTGPITPEELTGAMKRVLAPTTRPSTRP